MTIRIWQSVCLVCKEIYKVQLIDIQESKYNANCFSTGICPTCQQKRKEEKMKKALCEWQRKIKLVQRLVNQLNYRPDKNRIRQIHNQIKALLEYLCDDVIFTEIERRKE